MNLLYDRDDAIARLGGDAELFAAAAAMFVAESGTYRAALQAALATSDAAQLRREAHTVKGLLATFADDEGAEMALAIEMQLKAGKLDDLEAPIAALQARLLEVGEVLKAESVGQA